MAARQAGSSGKPNIGRGAYQLPSRRSTLTLVKEWLATMFDLSLVPHRLRPTEASTNTPRPEIDDLCTDLINRYRPVADTIENAQFTARYAKAVTSLAPFLGSNLDLSGLRVLEIGSGHGAKSLALAPFVKSYVGLEVSPGLVEFANGAKQTLGVENVTFELDEAANIAGFLARHDERFDVILLYAVLEHLTVDEKLTLLSECWKYLSDDGHLFIGETPNRMLPIDLHSSHLIYFQQAPLDIWKRSYDRAGNRKWAKAMQWAEEHDQFELGAYRRGRHIGHHELDLGLMPIEDLEHHVVDDGFSSHIMNLYFYMPIEFLKLVEFGFLDDYDESPHVVSRSFPPFLSRYFIEVLLSKKQASPRPTTTVQAAVGIGDRIRAGQLMRCDVIEPKSWSRWPIAPSPGAMAPRTAVIGFNQPCRVGSVEIAVDGKVIDELVVGDRVKLLRQWRQELAYEVTLPPNAHEDLVISNYGDEPCSVRYVALR